LFIDADILNDSFAENPNSDKNKKALQLLATGLLLN